MALFSKNWALRLVRNIAPTRELESFGPSLRGDLFDVFRTVCELSDRFSYGNGFSASFIPAATCLLKLFWRRKTLRFFFADVLRGLFIYEMAKKKSCQNICNPHVLFAAERDLYGWVNAEVFAQSSVITSHELPELRREMRLTEDVASERDYVLEAPGPSDRLPLQAPEDRTHFLWVYVELFTRLGVRPPFTDFQRELHAPPPENRFLSFRAYQGRQLFDAFEESILEFKWHYFKVFPFPGSHPFWLADEGKPFPWVYWNPEARECRITALDPLETLAFQFLQSLPVGLGKKLNFRCHWILDHRDAEVGAFLDSLLGDKEKKSRFDRLMQKMAETEGMGPRSVLPHIRAPGATSGASASNPVAPVSTLAASVPPVPPSGAVKAKKKPSVASFSKPFSVEGEEAVKEDLFADLRQKSESGRFRRLLLKRRPWGLIRSGNTELTLLIERSQRIITSGWLWILG
ncbi:hypothetical protein PIB30_065855 [Stylosanthes scabra]|uniref:Uncharacterized protein n=1 Tax=Stylosanthes scabra TaxID=79078 RepID=A0ABU6XMV3_9FABA|nr:hypothetical protein [Stylosanthes scabra]